MKKNIYIPLASLLLVAGFALSSFMPSPTPTGELEGTWKLVSYKYGEEEFFSEVPEIMQYRKILTPTHYQWVAYGNGEGDEVIGAGGGTYQYTGKKYTELAEFFYPHSTEIAGKKTVFQSTLNENKWTIEGIIRSIKIDPKTGKKEGIKETKMAEIWIRIE